MKKKGNLISFGCCLYVILICQLSSQAQIASKDEPIQGWDNKFSIGVNANSNLFINPTVGSGEDRLGIGLNINGQFKLNSGRFNWHSRVTSSFSIQKNGRGLLEDHEISQPFKKNSDQINIESSAKLKPSFFSKHLFIGEFSFRSQFLKTYQKNYLKDIEQLGYPISKFMAPATIRLSIGTEYKFNNMTSLSFYPISLKSIIVQHDSIAQMKVYDKNRLFIGTVHGNDFYFEESQLMFKNSNTSLGSRISLNYENSFLNEKLKIQSALKIYFSPKSQKSIPSHYSVKIQSNQFDFNWENQFSLQFNRNFSFVYTSNLFYDNTMFIRKSNRDVIDGLEPEYSKAPSYYHLTTIRYTFKTGRKR